MSTEQAMSDAVSLHESIAGAFASQGDWERAYQHLRAALELSRACPPVIPEQLRREVDRLRRERAQAREESLRDALTAVYNRRYLDRKLADLPAPFAVALVDIDLFKNVNDNFGHFTGDQVLRRVAALLGEGLPPQGFCARYGGEEFVLVLPAVAAGDAILLAEQVRTKVAEHPWPELCPGLAVTVSVGLACGAGGGTWAQVLDADRLLYAAKRAGRNRVAYRDSEDGYVIQYRP
ncbi:GGDEF domain-containing protein [Amycolatopsis cynarae]